MAKNLVFYLDIPMQRKHEIAWLLVKNNFKADKNFQNKFYDDDNIIHLNLLSGFKENSYAFSIRIFENNFTRGNYKIRGYDGLERFIKNLAKTH